MLFEIYSRYTTIAISSAIMWTGFVTWQGYTYGELGTLLFSALATAGANIKSASALVKAYPVVTYLNGSAIATAVMPACGAIWMIASPETYQSTYGWIIVSVAPLLVATMIVTTAIHFSHRTASLMYWLPIIFLWLLVVFFAAYGKTGYIPLPDWSDSIIVLTNYISKLL